MSTTPSIAAWTRNWAVARGVPCAYFESIASTNDAAKDRAGEDRAPLSLYVAEEQTAGRGRHSRKWTQSAPGEALLSTWSLAAAGPLQPIFAPLAGLALYRAISGAFPGSLFSLKAPNDLYLDKRKLAGLLIETVQIGDTHRAAVGLGLNALGAPRSSEFEAASLPPSITESTWTAFLDAFREELSQALKDGQRSELSTDARAALKDALNRSPLAPGAVLEVDALGQLRLASGLVRWQDL